MSIVISLIDRLLISFKNQMTDMKIKYELEVAQASKEKPKTLEEMNVDALNLHITEL